MVNYQDTCSNLENITHGMPQGSILGPLLFILLVNDLENQLTISSMLMYADDTVLYYSDKLSSKIEEIINRDAGILNNWVNENCLILNLKKGKTEFIMYGLRLSNHPERNIYINSVKIKEPA